MFWSCGAAYWFLGTHPASIWTVGPVTGFNRPDVIIKTPVSSREIGVFVIRKTLLQFLQPLPGLFTHIRIQGKGGELILVQHGLGPIGSHPQVERQVMVCFKTGILFPKQEL